MIWVLVFLFPTGNTDQVGWNVQAYGSGIQAEQKCEKQLKEYYRRSLQDFKAYCVAVPKGART